MRDEQRRRRTAARAIAWLTMLAMVTGVGCGASGGSASDAGVDGGSSGGDDATTSDASEGDDAPFEASIELDYEGGGDAPGGQIGAPDDGGPAPTPDAAHDGSPADSGDATSKTPPDAARDA